MPRLTIRAIRYMRRDRPTDPSYRKASLSETCKDRKVKHMWANYSYKYRKIYIENNNMSIWETCKFIGSLLLGQKAPLNAKKK